MLGPLGAPVFSPGQILGEAASPLLAPGLIA